MAEITANPSDLKGRLGGIWAGFSAAEKREVRKSNKSWADAVEVVFARQVAEFEKAQS